MIKKLVFSVVLGASLSRAEELNFPADVNKFHFINLYELEAKSKLHPLSSFRLLEIEKKYSDCLKKAPTLFQKNKLLQGWILTVWSQCQNKEFESKKDYKSLNAFLSTLDKNQDLLDKGAWKSTLQNQAQKILLAAVNDENKKRHRDVESKIKHLVFNKFSLWGPELKKWAQGQTENNLPSLNPKEKKEVSSTFEETLPVNKKEKLTSLDPILKGQSLDNFRIDREILMELLNQTYRKMEYQNLIQVSDAVEKYFIYSQSYPNFLVMLGRSYHFTGQYEKALKIFQKIIVDYADAEEFQESLFRSGLVSFRLGKFSEAKKFLETLYSLKKDKYDITGRYWWIKSLELTSDKRFAQEKKNFIFEYPYSYFGIKLQSESDENKPDVFKEDVKLPNSKWELLGEVEQSWQRFKELSQRGWVLEAQAEVQSIPAPTNPVNIYYYSLLLAKSYQHPLSVKLMNQLLESTHDIRSLEMLKSIYPLTYSQKIKQESEKYKINPVLIMSLIRQESSFGLKALSSSQAAGLMQMIQPTAMEVAGKLKMKIQFPEDLYRPEINIPMGTFYYSDVLKDFNMHVPLALAGYNAGPHKIKSFIALREETKKIPTEKLSDWESEIWIDELPWGETTGYVKSILRNTLIYQLLQGKALKSQPDFWRDFIVLNQ